MESEREKLVEQIRALMERATGDQLLLLLRFAGNIVR